MITYRILYALLIFVVSGVEAAPCSIVIFGATGDLTSRKLLPALYHLVEEGDISEPINIVGVSRTSYTDQAFRALMKKSVATKHADFWDQFADHLFYHPSEFDSDKGYVELERRLKDIEDGGEHANRIYYLATPPSYFSTIIKMLHDHGMLSNSSRIIVEKPFGHDLQSALALQKEISKYLDNEQVYLMDHYLGKEGVQNLLTLRFENTIFEPLWNHEHIDNVQITMSEDIGIGTRAQFWEETGLLRDVVQNHFMQILALLTMEPPATLEASDVHTEKIKALDSIRPFPLEELDSYIVRGQYEAGEIGGIAVPGYKQEQGVPSDSNVETFVAAKLFIDNPRWKGVPFFLRAGKRLPKQTTEIVITFKKSPLANRDALANVLAIRIQPNACVCVQTLTKIPGLDQKSRSVVTDYDLGSSREAYERLLYDAMRGDHSLYVDPEEHLAAWRLFTPVINHWKNHPRAVQSYPSGTWGPPNVHQLFDGNTWVLLEDYRTLSWQKELNSGKINL